TGVSSAVVVVKRVVEIAANVEVDPRREASPGKTRFEIATKVVVPPSRSRKQSTRQEVRRNHVAGRVAPVRSDDAPLDHDGGEEQAAVLQGEIPVALDEDVAGRRP